MDCKDWRAFNRYPPKSNVLWWQEWHQHSPNCPACQKWAEEFFRRLREDVPADEDDDSSADDLDEAPVRPGGQHALMLVPGGKC